MKKEKGYVLHEGKLGNDKFTCVATLRSSNRKTGDMVQLWFILTDVHPVEAVQTGLDAKTICNDCRFAGGNGCYVNVGQGVASVWKAYKRGLYPALPVKRYGEVFKDRKVRFGAYGNPSHLPLAKVKLIANLSDGWTGYFHDWQSMPRAKAEAYGRYFMASTETEESRCKAENKGLRYFHVSPTQPENTIECLNVTHGIDCLDCLMCNGNATGAKSIVIPPHGAGKAKAIQVALNN